MIVERSKNKVKYKCDRCKKDMDFKERYALYLMPPGKSTGSLKKYIDLCSKCMKALHRGIKRGVSNG